MTFGKESLVTQDYPELLCSHGDSSDPVTWEGKKKKRACTTCGARELVGECKCATYIVHS